MSVYSCTADTAEKLGRMSNEQLDAIHHCLVCLESYERCQCWLGRQRRREAEEQNTESESK